ncbi:hypothetical protein KSD_48910 [Ktedonobacter sp. SOSP1-85]|nr:hypothetical protein KSD_48910 [Ktedonobacter sp. SOSP1-85]
MILLMSKGGRENVFSPALQKGTGEVSGFPQGPGDMLGLNDEDKFLWNSCHQRLFPFWMGNTTEG